MRINLLYEPECTVLSDYKNVRHINTHPGQNEEKGVIIGDVRNLDWLCETAECTSLIATNILSYFEPTEFDNILRNWVGKLRHGGSLIISDIDIKEVARHLTYDKISIPEANQLIYRGRKLSASLSVMAKILQSFDLQIIKKRLNGFYYTVEGKRK